MQVNEGAAGREEEGQRHTPAAEIGRNGPRPVEEVLEAVETELGDERPGTVLVVTDIEMPATPQRIWEAINSNGGAA